MDDEPRNFDQVALGVGETGNTVFLPCLPSRSPLIRAALELLKGPPADPLALIMVLCDRFPNAPRHEVAATLRQTAVVLAHYGILPRTLH